VNKMRKLLLIILLICTVDMSYGQWNTSNYRPDGEFFNSQQKTYTYDIEPVINLDITPINHGLLRHDKEKSKWFRKNKEEPFTGVSIEKNPETNKDVKPEEKEWLRYYVYTFKDGKTIKQEEYFYNGQIDKVWYIPMKDGQRKTYYPDGSLFSISYLKNGFRQGLSTTYHNNGELWSERNYKNGKREGWETGFYEDGRLRYEEYYINGKREGKHKFYHKNGNIRSVTNWKNDIQHGIKEQYYEDVTLLSQKTVYKNGDLLEKEEYFHHSKNVQTKTIWDESKETYIKTRYSITGKITSVEETRYP